MNFQAYLNDYRFCYVDNSSVANNRLLAIINLAKICRERGIEIYLTKNPFQINWLHGNISSLIGNDRELKNGLASIWQKSTIVNSQRNENAVYTFEEISDGVSNTQDVSDSVMADAYESDSEEMKSILLNLEESLPNPIVRILKDSNAAKDIHSFSTNDRIVMFFQNIGLLKRYYDTKCSYIPNDSETILSDRNLFTPTDLYNKGARLYERNENKDELWCRDTKHFGSSVHLEVFSRSSNKQIHVSKHDEINFFRDLTKEESKRFLKDLL